MAHYRRQQTTLMASAEEHCETRDCSCMGKEGEKRIKPKTDRKFHRYRRTLIPHHAFF